MMDIHCGRTARFAVLIGLTLVGAPATALAAEIPAVSATAVVQASDVSETGGKSFLQQASAEAGQDGSTDSGASQAAASPSQEDETGSAAASAEASDSSADASAADGASLAAEGTDPADAGGTAEYESPVADHAAATDEGAEDIQPSADQKAKASGVEQMTSRESTEAAQASASEPEISITADVDGKGEVEATSGQIVGTVGEDRLLDSVKVSIGSAGDGAETMNTDLEYRAHIQDDGWGSWTTSGNVVGVAGSGKRIEALQFRLRTGSAPAAEWEIWSRAYVQGEGWIAWTDDGPIGSTGHGLRLEAFEIRLVSKADSSDDAASSDDSAAASSIQADFSSEKDYPFIDGTKVEVQAHVQDVGWQGWVSDGDTAGTVSKSKRLEALRFKVENAYLDGDIEAQAHVEDIGWQGWKTSDSIASTTGQGKRIEAIQFRLTGDLEEAYDIWYQANVQAIGWMGWTKDGSSAGTTGVCGRMEALQVLLLKKGSAAPAASDQGTTLTFISAPQIEYSAHVQDIGWQSKVSGNEVAGTTVEAKRIEAMTIELVEGDDSCPGGVRYRAHVQGEGWLDWVSDGEIAGTTGQARRAEAFQVELTGEISKFFDICYCAHVQDVGWVQWVRNGEVAGTTGRSLAVEAYCIKLVLKEDGVPGAGIDYCWLANSPYWTGTVKQKIMNIHYSAGRYDDDAEVQHYIKQIVIHHNAGTLTTETCWQTWQTRAASAHYEVEADGTVGQLVYDSDTAWHAGNWYENLDSIGVEHADAPGSSSGNWYLTEETTDSGAKLAALLCLQYDLGRPQWGVNVVGHGDVSSTECPASRATGGSQHDEYLAKAQSWYDHFMTIQSV